MALVEETADTLPQWLHNRWRHVMSTDDWGALTEGDRLFWKHEADAVRRAVARGGFKKEASGHGAG